MIGRKIFAVIFTILVLVGFGFLTNWVQGESGIRAYAVEPLKNAGFEEGFRNYNGVGELGVAEDWAPWYTEGNGYNRPEYKPETPESRICNGDPCGRVYDGDFSQKQFTTFAKQDGGIRQSVPTVKGLWYRFSAKAYVWSNNQDDPDSSGDNGKCSALVGINPWGDWNATYRTTIWGKEALNVYNQWVTVDVVAQAWGNEISLFTRGTCEWAVKHNDFYWDVTAFDLANVPVPPESTPIPTATYTPVPIPPTPTPTPEGPVTECPSIEEIDRIIKENLEMIKVIIP